MKLKIVLLLVTVVFARAADDPADACRTHLRNLGGAVKAYALIHDNKVPTKLSDLYLDGLVDSLADFTCPGSGVKITAASEIDLRSDYALGTGDMLVRETAARHGGQALAIFADGSIKPATGAVKPAANTAQAATPTATPRSAPVPSSTPVATSTAPAVARRDTTTSARATASVPSEPAIASRPALPAVASDADEEPAVAASPGFQAFERGAARGAFPEDMSAIIGLAFAVQKDGKLVVTSVRADSIGEAMGLQPGDQVLAINEKPLKKNLGEARAVTLPQLAKLVGAPANESLQLTVRQIADDSEVTFALPTGMNGNGIQMRIPAQPADEADEGAQVHLIPPGTQLPALRPVPPAPVLGIPRQSGSAYLGTGLQDSQVPGGGAFVVDVERGGPSAASGGLKAGDMIVAVNGEPVENSRQVVEIIAKFPPGTRVDFLVVRDRKNQKASVTLGQRQSAMH